MESKAVATTIAELWGFADSLIDVGNPDSDHEMAISCVPGTILRVAHEFVSFTFHHIFLQ